MRLCLYRGASAGLGGGSEKGRGTVGPFLLGCEVGQAVCCLKLQKWKGKHLPQAVAGRSLFLQALKSRRDTLADSGVTALGSGRQ